MLAPTHLPITGDVQGGLYPSLGTWLDERRGWSPMRVRVMTALVDVEALCLRALAGVLIDRIGWPRPLIVATCACILAVTPVLAARSFPAVFAARMLSAASGVCRCPPLPNPRSASSVRAAS
jgi:nitrate/nitrite transporter NarK